MHGLPNPSIPFQAYQGETALNALSRNYRCHENIQIGLHARREWDGASHQHAERRIIVWQCARPNPFTGAKVSERPTHHTWLLGEKAAQAL
jgi:hypothetical protein